MAEAIIRQHKRREDRWMPKESRRFDPAKCKIAVQFAARALPGFLLSCAELVGIPAGLHGALGIALGALGLDIRPLLAGGGCACLLRWASGMGMRWDGAILLGMIALMHRLVKGRSTICVSACAAVIMLPTAIASCLAATAAEMLKGWAALVIVSLSATIFARAVKVLARNQRLSSMEDRVAVGYLAAMCLCGGARMLLMGISVGGYLAGCVTVVTALVLGTGAGAMTGMLAGAVLALQGIPLTMAVALSVGGFLAGVANTLSRRRLSCGMFAVGAYLPLLLCGGTALGCGAAVLCAGITAGLAPRPMMEKTKQTLRRYLQNDPVMGDAYAAAALTAWEQTIAAMARAVPVPRSDSEERNGQWWQERLCQGCPEYEGCGCMATALGVTKAEAVWSYRQSQDDIWRDALDNLRGIGCQRLYQLMAGMDALRSEDETQRRMIRRVEMQRNMLVTHLTAMSGAARRFATLSTGESWWDDMAARRIRNEMAQRAIPATLSYVRRVQGHAQAAFELQFLTGARKQGEELCVLASAVLEVPMEVAQIDGERIWLRERPLMTAWVGMSVEPITKGRCCGDTAWHGILQDGRCMVALCDGMGHGEQAALASRQAVELLRLCLDAGYSRQQTLTASNGMMLLGGGGERFATADVLTIDLWKGTATLDKLGSAATWLYHEGKMTRYTGDSLPLGILEDIELKGLEFQVHEGDALILMTDGVEEAFPSVQVLEAALCKALEEASPQDAADAVLLAAGAADEMRRDDQSVVVVYIRREADGR